MIRIFLKQRSRPFAELAGIATGSTAAAQAKTGKSRGSLKGFADNDTLPGVISAACVALIAAGLHGESTLSGAGLIVGVLVLVATSQRTLRAKFSARLALAIFLFVTVGTVFGNARMDWIQGFQRYRIVVELLIGIALLQRVVLRLNLHGLIKRSICRRPPSLAFQRGRHLVDGSDLPAQSGDGPNGHDGDGLDCHAANCGSAHFNACGHPDDAFGSDDAGLGCRKRLATGSKRSEGCRGGAAVVSGWRRHHLLAALRTVRGCGGRTEMAAISHYGRRLLLPFRRCPGFGLPGSPSYRGVWRLSLHRGCAFFFAVPAREPRRISRSDFR